MFRRISQPSRTSIGITITLLEMAVRAAKPERQSPKPWEAPTGWIPLEAAIDQLLTSRVLVNMDKS